MYTTLLRKFASPSLASSLITRPHIVSRVQKSILYDDRQPTPTRLILIHTPAGYGKTTLLVELAQKTPIQWYWYQLDQTDADLTTFLQRLLVSIRQYHPAFGQELDTFLTSTPLLAHGGDISPQVTQFLETFIAVLEQTITEPFALVLGNYHYIAQHPGICAFLNRLLYKLPAHGVLIIESRTLPELDVASLLARREMVGFGTDLLRFSAQEIYELALLLGISSFTPQEAKYITTAFEGWITGMLLGTRLSGMHTSCPIRNTPNSSIASLVDQQYLLSYMVNLTQPC